MTDNVIDFDPADRRFTLSKIDSFLADTAVHPGAESSFDYFWYQLSGRRMRECIFSLSLTL